MTIIELPNGIRIHADVVEIASDGSINAYTEDHEEIAPDPAVEQKAIGTEIHEKLEEFNRIHGDDDTQSLEKDLDKSIRYNELTDKNRAVYDYLKEFGPAKAVNVAEYLEVTAQAVYARISKLREVGLVTVVWDSPGMWKVS